MTFKGLRKRLRRRIIDFWESVSCCRHEWSGTITGFTHEGYACGRCKRCNEPIIDPKNKAGEFLLHIYQNALDDEDDED